MFFGAAPTPLFNHDMLVCVSAEVWTCVSFLCHYEFQLFIRPWWAQCSDCVRRQPTADWLWVTRAPRPLPAPQVSRHMKSYAVWTLSEALSARRFHNQGNLDAAGKHFSLCFIYKWAVRRERSTLIHEASASRLRWITSRSEKLIVHLVRRCRFAK